MLILISFNAIFIVQWLYYFLVSFKFKNHNMKLFIKIYGSILCKKNATQDNETEAELEESIKINIVKAKSNSESKKMNKKSGILNSR